jgi:hypothetical protein
MTDKSQWTPGPWVSNSRGEVQTEDGMTMICRAHLHDTRRTEAETLSNARLISAAPDMYEAGIEALHALKSARDFIMSKHGTSNPHRDKTISDLEAALSTRD